jgi:hypothetical protein
MDHVVILKFIITNSIFCIKIMKKAQNFKNCLNIYVASMNMTPVSVKSDLIFLIELPNPVKSNKKYEGQSIFLSCKACDNSNCLKVNLKILRVFDSK